MPDATNSMTDALQLVQTDIINNLLPRTINPENGFSLELFRAGNYVGSTRSNQTKPLVARKGDILYRINLGPHTQLVTGRLRAQGGYTREYSVQVGLQVMEPARFLELYRQGRDPVHLALQDIQAALQEYADRTTYERMHPANIEGKATYAFNKEPGNLKAGLRIVGVYQPTLGEDKTYQQINASPVIAVNGKLTTREGYVRDYTLTVELAVTDFQFYRYVEATGTSPLDRAKDAINNELQKYARQQFYDDLADSHLRDVSEHALDNLTNEFIGGLKIVHIHAPSLGPDKTYQPIDISPILLLNGQLTTREGYVRRYELSVELRVTNYRVYRYLKYTATGTAPLDRVKTAIDSELQEYARQQFYEDLTDLQLRPVVEHAFDNLTSHITECLAIVRVHRLSIGDDSSYQPIDLSPLLTISGQLTTRENYVRDYDLTVELHVTDRWLYLQLTRDGSDPLNLAQAAINGEIQKYARQQFYEDLSEAQLFTIVEHAFDDLSSPITGGLAIVRSHRLSLGDDKTYRPINLSPLLTVTGELTTREGYVRSYKLIVELLINDRRLFQHLTYEGADPLDHAKVVINGELQKYARQQFYEDLSETQLFAIVEHAFDTLSSRVTGDITIVRPHQLSLGEDRTYQPINLSPLLTINGQLTTREGHVRNYELIVELRITDRWIYRQLTREGTNPLNLAKVAIDGELQKYTSQQFYEDLSESQLLTIVEHAFDDLSNRVTGGMAIVRPHRLSLGEDKNYKPINLSPLLTVEGKLTTLEGYVCDYNLTVELLIKDRRKYQELTYEGADPLGRAQIAIDGALQRYARLQSYDDLSKAELDTIVEQAFDDLSSRVTYDMEIVRAHQFSLKEPPRYIHLGPRTLTIAGKLTTSDLRERAYEMTVILEVTNASDFTQLMRQGNDPLNLVKIAIDGAIQHVVEGKKHDEISEQHLPPAAYAAFDSFDGSTIGGLKITEAHKVILHVDSKLQETAEIVHQTDVEKVRLEQQAALEKRESLLKFENTQQAEHQELALEDLRQARAKSQYLFDLEKKATVEAHQLRGELAQKLLAQLTERISEDLQASVSLHDIVEQINVVSNYLQLAPPQTSSGNTNNNNKSGQIQNNQQPQSHALEAGQSEQSVPQISSTSSAPRRNRKSIDEWGIELVEITVPSSLREDVDDQERAFQVCDIAEEALILGSPFQEADILIKINGRRVYTLEALETALTMIQPTAKVKVIVLRDKIRNSLTLDPPYNADVQEQGSDASIE